MNTTTSQENELYSIINDALFDVCKAKPNEPLEHLSQKLLELIGEQPILPSEVRTSKQLQNPQENVAISKEKIFLKRLMQDFNQNYTIKEKIGAGKSGEVFLCNEKSDPNTTKVVKIIYKNKQKSNELSETNIEMMLKLDHTNLVQIFDLIEDENHMYIVQEYCQLGDLYQFIFKNKNKITLKQIKEIISQILDALQYLHAADIMHRDIKPENILVKQVEPSLVVKICDFGTITYFPKNASLSSIVGSPFFIAPEVLNGNYTELSDIWSVGAITYLLLGGKPPYVGKKVDVLFQVMNDDYEFLPQHSEEDRKFISALMDRNVSSRVSAKEARKLPWLDSQEAEIGIALEALDKMTKFTTGHNLKRSILSYIKSRRLFEDRSEKMAKMFKALDVNKDGRLDAQEIIERFGKYFPGTPEKEQEQIRALIDKFDIDGTGMVDYSEFLMMSTNIKSQENKEKLKEIFDFFDVDKDKFITSADLREIFEDRDISERRFDEMIKEFDVDGDNKISLEEFYRIMTKN